jgi:26S proteasome regulatory subunit T3
MLVKAVANSTTASFIRVNGSEFVQKYLGEGPRMVRDVFRMARENSPAIIFIDEIDAIATKRFDAQTGADREVQRILLELLNQMDGFEQTSNVKVIMATNRADTLDPALLRPGRLDRKIEFPNLRDRRERRLIFTTIASKMSLSPEVDLDSLIVRNDPLSGAVIAAIMQEAGLRAVRKNRYNIIQSDLDDAYAAQVKSGQDDDRYVFLFPTCPVRVTDYFTVPTSTGKLLALWGWVDAGGKSLTSTVVLSIICDTWEYIYDSSCVSYLLCLNTPSRCGGSVEDFGTLGQPWEKISDRPRNEMAETGHPRLVLIRLVDLPCFVICSPYGARNSLITLVA